MVGAWWFGWNFEGSILGPAWDTPAFAWKEWDCVSDLWAEHWTWELLNKTQESWPFATHVDFRSMIKLRRIAERWSVREWSVGHLYKRKCNVPAGSLIGQFPLRLFIRFNKKALHQYLVRYVKQQAKAGRNIYPPRWICIGSCAVH